MTRTTMKWLTRMMKCRRNWLQGQSDCQWKLLDQVVSLQGRKSPERTS
ncbi:hypothetical protein CFC21_030476, partial [Triticum aestivum]